MPTRRVVKGVLHNFLGTYTSRYSDHRGYWLFGQLPSDLWEWTLDLLETAPESSALIDVAGRLAARRFAEQIGKSGLTLHSVLRATLRLARSTELVEGWQGDRKTEGRMVRFIARAVMDNARIYEDECTVFVAPHNPEKERRRLEADWGT